MPRKIFWAVQAVFVLSLLWLVGTKYFLLKKTVLPVLATVPDFTLTERSGRTIKKSDLAGKVWIADFIFTRCAGICPTMTLKMKSLAHDLKSVRFVSFSVDPEYDSSLALSDYADRYEIKSEPWWFLTGARETLNRIATALHMNKIDEPMMHSGRFVLVDKKGQVRAYADSSDENELGKLTAAAKSLL